MNRQGEQQLDRWSRAVLAWQCAPERLAACTRRVPLLLRWALLAPCMALAGWWIFSGTGMFAVLTSFQAMFVTMPGVGGAGVVPAYYPSMSALGTLISCALPPIGAIAALSLVFPEASPGYDARPS